MNLKERILAVSALMSVSGFEARAHAALREQLDGIFDEITADAAEITVIRGPVILIESDNAPNG